MGNKDEITRCKDDILYFVEKYERLKTDDGIMPLHLTELQKRYLKKIVDEETREKAIKIKLKRRRKI